MRQRPEIQEVLWSRIGSLDQLKEPANLRMKLTACGTLTHGRVRRRSHAAAYARR
jgi:hypothetical protein